MTSSYKKERIPAAVRNAVWLKWVEDKNAAKCYCCKLESITNANWHCGHIISEKNGGAIHLNNLRPICAGCNSSMGKMNMHDFMKKYGFDTILNNNNNTGVKNKPNLKKKKNESQKDRLKTFIKDMCNDKKCERFTMKELLKTNILDDAGYGGKTPDRSLSRDLQRLRDENIISFEGNGNYKYMLKLDKVKGRSVSMPIINMKEEDIDSKKYKKKYDDLKKKYDDLKKKYDDLSNENINFEKDIDIENPMSVFNYGIKHKFHGAYPLKTYVTNDEGEDIESKEKFVVILKHYYKRNNELEYKNMLLDNYENLKKLGLNSFDKVYGYVRTMTEFMRGFGECKCFDLTLELCNKLKTGSKKIYLINENARFTAKCLDLSIKTQKIYDYQGMNEGNVERDDFKLVYVYKNEFLNSLKGKGGKNWIDMALFDGDSKNKDIENAIKKINEMNSFELVDLLRKQKLRK